MASFNKVILIGNMVADPELKQTPQGTSVCSFSLAVNRKMEKDKCDFISIVAWRQTAEFVCKYFKKGEPILVCGQIQTRSWNDAKGNKRYTTEVVADEVSFVGKKEENAPNVPYVPDAYKSKTEFEPVDTTEGLPF
jgi:single-strand DNA-binding protein